MEGGRAEQGENSADWRLRNMNTLPLLWDASCMNTWYLNGIKNLFGCMCCPGFVCLCVYCMLSWEGELLNQQMISDKPAG